MDILIPVTNTTGGPVKTAESLSAGTDTVQADDISFGLIMSGGNKPPRPSLFEKSPHTFVSAGAKPSPALRNLPDIPGIIKILPVTAESAEPLLNPVPPGPNPIDKPIGNPSLQGDIPESSPKNTITSPSGGNKPSRPSLFEQSPHTSVSAGAKPSPALRNLPDIPGIIKILPVAAEPAGPLLNPVPPGPNPASNQAGNPSLHGDITEISSKNTITSPSNGQQISKDINPVKTIPGNRLSISGESSQPAPATAKASTEDIPATETGMKPENILLHTGNKGHNEPPAEIRNMTKPSGVNHIETASLIKKDDVISMKVSLDPDGLGRLDIRLVLNKGIINGHINTSDIIGKEVMEKNLDNIVYTLIKDGLNVGGLSVSLRNKGNETAYNHGGKERNPARSAGEIRMPDVRSENRMVNIFI